MSLIKCGIYGIFRISDNKVLIGSSNHINNRWAVHRRFVRNNKHWNIHFQRAWNLIGEDGFEYRIVELCKEDMLLKREKAWIDYYAPNIFNICLDPVRHILSAESKLKISLSKIGKKRGPLSKEWKRKIGLASKGRKQSKETRKKKSEAVSGIKHWLYGKHHSKETRRKMSLSRMGNKNSLGFRHSKESKLKMSLSQKGKHSGPFSEEHKLNISLAHLGKKHSEETKRKMSEIYWRRFCSTNAIIT